MLVTFKCNVSGEFTMLGDMAHHFLKMMGHSGTIPGAISADDIPAALEKLKNAVDAEKKTEISEKENATEDDDNDEPRISVTVRAYPLIEMLTAAARSNSDVMWYKNQ